MAKTRRKKRIRKKSDGVGKIVVSVMLRTQDNRFVKGNVMRVFSVSGQRVSRVADALKPVLDALR